jgi:hypothetical protein
MDDQVFLKYMEKSIFETMLEGCLIEAHLGYETYNPGVWRVSLNAVEVARLLDMAKTQTNSVKTEREECAKLCEEVGKHPSLQPRHCAESIRARGQA